MNLFDVPRVLSLVQYGLFTYCCGSVTFDVNAFRRGLRSAYLCWVFKFGLYARKIGGLVSGKGVITCPTLLIFLLNGIMLPYCELLAKCA